MLGSRILIPPKEAAISGLFCFPPLIYCSVSFPRVSAIARKLGLPAPEREYRFDPKRRWRFDFAWPSLKLAVEIEGGVWIRGRHVRPVGYLADLEKYNRAVVLGWRVLRYAPHQIGQLERDLCALLDAGERLD